MLPRRPLRKMRRGSHQRRPMQPGALGELAPDQHRMDATSAMLVFFMQPIRTGRSRFIRTKNTANVLMKNLVDFMFGSILFWFIGFGLMFGIGGFVGAPHFFNLEAMDKIIDNGLPIEGFLIFQTVFCATAATIVSGAMAERTKFSMYLSILSLSAYSFIRFRPLPGRRMADERETRLLYDEDVRHYFS